MMDIRMPPSSLRRSRDRTGQGRFADGGFTLLEIVVAFAMLAASLAVLMPAFGSLGATASRVEAQGLAAEIAQSLLADVGAEGPLPDGEQKGTLRNGYSWTILARPFETGIVQDSPGRSMRLMEVTVSVKPAKHGTPVNLTTLRLERAE